MRKIIKDCLTERNCESYDCVRILGCIGFIIYNIITVKHSLHNCDDFNPINYSTGLAILLGVISAGVTFKYSKET